MLLWTLCGAAAAITYAAVGYGAYAARPDADPLEIYVFVSGIVCLIWMFFGCIVGCLCVPVSLYCLKGKDRRTTHPILFSVLPVLAIVLAAIVAPYSTQDPHFAGVVAVTVAAYVALCLVMRAKLHGPFEPSCCQSCGYDLSGNVSGRCPECGVPTGDAADVPHERPF